MIVDVKIKHSSSLGIALMVRLALPACRGANHLSNLIKTILHILSIYYQRHAWAHYHLPPTDGSPIAKAHDKDEE